MTPSGIVAAPGLSDSQMKIGHSRRRHRVFTPPRSKSVLCRHRSGQQQRVRHQFGADRQARSRIDIVLVVPAIVSIGDIMGEDNIPPRWSEHSCSLALVWVLAGRPTRSTLTAE